MSGSNHRAQADSPRLFSTGWFAAAPAQRAAAATDAGARGVVAPNTSATSPAVNQSIANFTQAAMAIAHAQALQSQASEAAAAAASTTVPDGLGPGALQPDPTAWTNAALPAQSSASGRTNVTIQQTAQQAILTWTSFNVGQHTNLTFDQSEGGASANTWVVLNRVNDPTAAPSQILGSITAPGQVLVVDRNGIIFGAGAQINVGALVAATADLADADFVASFIGNGIYGSPGFTGASNGVTVAQGASIATNAPAGATNHGGFVMLLGSSVENDGAISTPNGQTILAAGQSFVLRQGYGNSAGTGNAQTSTTLGTEVAVTTAGGAATNTGLIQATTGDITMVGQSVTQAGVAYATTSVAQRGTIHLLTNATDPTTGVTLAPGSVTTILPDTSGAAVSDAQRATLIDQSALPAEQAVASLLNDQILLPDRLDQSRIEITTGGTVDFAGGSLTMATGGQIAVYAKNRVFVEAGSLLDVAGSVNVVLPASANALTVQMQPFQLRDAPANRDSGALNSQTVNVNIGQLVLIAAGTGGYAQDRYYTAGGLLEVGGELSNVAHTVQEWAAPGGSITLSASQVVAQPGATFNLAGGTLNYQAGQVPTTWLMGSDGRLYNVNTAPSDLTYTGVFSGYTVTHPRWGITETFGNPLIAPATIYQGAYTVGRDAGTLTISAPTDVFEAAIDAGVVTGAEQSAARPAGAAEPLLPNGTIDPFLLTNATVPLPGSLVLTNLVVGALPFATDVQISDSIAPLAAALDSATAVPAARQDTAWFSAGLLDSAGLGGLSIATSGAITIASPLSLADGGQVSLLAPTTDIAAPLVTRSGSVSITDNAEASSGGIEFLLPAGGNGIGVTLGAGGAIDTRGLFTNLMLTPGDVATQAFAAGGPVSIDSSQAVDLAPGSVIDASAGGTVLTNGKAIGAAGGAISLIAYDPNAYGGASPPVRTPPAIVGTLRSYGSTQGGALTIELPNVLISDAPGAGASGQLVLPSAFFAAGFSSYTIASYDGISVAPNTQVAVVEPVYQFTAATLAAPTGSDPSAALALVLPPVYLANPAIAQVIQRQGASLTLLAARGAGQVSTFGGPIDLGNGASISVDPGSKVKIEALGQITVDGSITAPGGSISLTNDTQQTGPGASPSYQPGLSIWLGAASVLDVSAQAFTATNRQGRPFGVVPAGGTIQIGSSGGANSTDAYIIAQPGSVMQAAGTSASIDPAAGTGSTAGTRLVASNGGSVALDSASGLLLAGSIAAPAGGPGAQGGTLSVALITPDYVSELITANAQNRLLVPRELGVGAGPGGITLPAGAQPGDALPDSAIGQAYVTTGLLSTGGFDAVTLTSSDAIAFDGSVALTAGRAITLNAGILADTTATGSVSIAAPYVTLNGAANPIYSGGLAAQLTGTSSAVTNSGKWLPSAQISDASFSVAAGNVDITGNMFVGARVQVPQGGTGPTPLSLCAGAICTADLPGFAQITLASTGDIRFLPGAAANGATAYTTLTTPGDLTFVAGQIYPVAGATALVTAGFDFSASNAFQPDGILSIEPADGPTPAVPLTAGGFLQLAAGTIAQGGVLRAPMGQIALGAVGNNGNEGPQISGGSHTLAIDLLPGSITSVSADGATIPYGGTADGVAYTVNGNAPPLNPSQGLVPIPQITLYGQSVAVASGATLDLSGGGSLAGAGFVSGRGGSTDVLSYPLLALNASAQITAPSVNTNQVFAIIPGYAGVASPPATATPFTGPLPQPGQAITIPAGVPGLAAGTYTLLPGSDALLPGAFRVQMNTAAYTPSAWRAGAVAIGDGSYQVDAYTAVAGTGFHAGLPVVVTVTSGSAVRSLAQYDEETYGQFIAAQAALSGESLFATPVPNDAKTLTFAFPAPNPNGPSLVMQGYVNMQPATGGFGGIAQIVGSGNNIAITPDGAAPSATAIAVPASALDALNAETMVVGGTVAPPSSGSPEINFTGQDTGVTLQAGATLAASQVFLVGGGVTIEPGAGIDTLGRGAPTLDSSNGLVFANNNYSLVAVSNGNLTFLPASYNSTPAIGPVTIGQCPATSCSGTSALYGDGTVAIVTTDTVAIGSAARFGAQTLDLSVSSINIGTPASAQPVPPGLNLDQATLTTLLAGDPSTGIPALAQLTLTANQSINFYGSAALDSTSLAQIELDAPAIYGAGGPNATATLTTTGTLIWNGVGTGLSSALTPTASASAGPWLAGGPGTGSGSLTISAARIVLGYGPNEPSQNQTALSRLMLGFSGVTLSASQSITTANRGSLAVYQAATGYRTGTGTTYSGGNLTLVTPVLQGGAGSFNSITAGGALSIVAPIGGPAAIAGAGAPGAEIDLAAASISNATAIALPSGRLVMQSAGDIDLNSSSHLDLAGRTPSLFDQSLPSFGGAVVLQSANGNVTQAAGAVIDVSAAGNDAGSLSVTATGAAAGQVSLGGSILGSAPAGSTAGSFDLSATALDPAIAFSALNDSLNAGGVFGSRSFDVQTGSLTIGSNVRAHSVSVSVDAGSLEVAGMIDASGGTPGSITLAARDGLTLDSTAVLDAHGGVLQADSSGQPIAAENRAMVDLSVRRGRLTLATGATINVSSPDTTPQGDVQINVPRTGETSGNADIVAGGPVTIKGAETIAVNAFWTYVPTDPNGTIVQDNGGGATGAAVAASGADAGFVGLNQVNASSQAFMAIAGTDAMLQSNLQGLTTYGPAFHLRPGVEIDSNGNLTVSGDIDLSGYRYSDPSGYGLQVGSSVGSGEPGVLLLRAAGNLNVYGSINDGFYLPGTAAYSSNPDNQGWVLKSTPTLDGGNLVLPGAVTLLANTQFQNANVALNYAITVTQASAVLAANAVVPTTLALFSPVTLPAGTALRADITDPTGIVYPAGTILGTSTTLPAGSTLAAGTQLPVQLTFNAGALWPAGANLAAFAGTVTLGANAALVAGDIIPGGATLQLGSASSVAGGATCASTGSCNFRPSGGQVWAVAPMLPAGASSWSLDLVAGADVAAANQATLLAPAALATTATASNPTPGSIVLSDPHYQLPNSTMLQASWSVIRTGTGDLSLQAGGDVQEASLFGIYTAGTQAATTSAFDLPRATPLGGTALGTTYSAYNALVASSTYQAYYPNDGGNVLIAAQGDVTGDIEVNPSNATNGGDPVALDGVGSWLWRQGGANGQPTAWWINFGTYALPSPANTSIASEVPALTGFAGIGALGGGNVTIVAGGNAGVTTPVTNPAFGYTGSHGLDVAVASTGQVSGGTTSLTGGGDITIQVAGQINGASTRQDDMNGTITDLRGKLNVRAGSIGKVDLVYGRADPLDLNATSPLIAVSANSLGGLTVVPGDASVELTTLGDLVLGGVGDATRLVQANATPVPTSSGCAGTCLGYTWFSLWQPDTSIALYSAGGNVTPSTQSSAASSGNAEAFLANSVPTNGIWMYPPTLLVDAPSGNIFAGSVLQGVAFGAASIELAPSPTGQLELLAGESINADQYVGTQGNAIPAVFDISGANLSALATPQTPAYALFSVTTTRGHTSVRGEGRNLAPSALPLRISGTPESAGTINDNLFAFGPDTATDLHAGDLAPALVYAGSDILDLHLGETLAFETAAGTITGTWYLAAKSVRMLAGGDIVEPEIGALKTALPEQYNTVQSDGASTSSSDLIYNANASDVSEIEAGRNVIYASAAIAGPGQLWVQAGGNVYEADQGTIESLGVNPNAQVGSGGASVTVLAGVGAPGPDWTGFADLYLNTANQASAGTPVGVGTGVVAATYADQLLAFLQQNDAYQGSASNALAFFQALPVEQRRQFLLGVYFDELNDSGLEFPDPTSVLYKSYARGREAIAALFPSGTTSQGSITLSSGYGTNAGGQKVPISSSILTLHGGDITLLTPGGDTTLGLASGAPPPAGTGVLTEGGGNIDIYALGDVALGQSRIFTILSGNIMIWSATGNINAGRGANTTSASTPVSVAYDQFGNVALAPSATVTGAGIATLAPLAGTTPGNLNLVAPEGIIDAGEAGIRASGNANLTALTVANAANVQIGGKTSGVPTVAAPNVGAISAASATAAAAAQSAQQMAQAGATGTTAQAPSNISVSVTGFGE
ncbi:MAG TPA: filamentous hemagglutinin family protein [Acetobacteraceae bacterium]|nr:filamentous hemagglutinin family protein [Acetobacteraceae bacterium]